MKKILPLFIIFHFSLFTFHSSAQQMRDLFANTPDSILPLLTKNNRLDCIDFIENNMQARVKNRLDSWSELKALTADYMLLQVSERSTMEMKLLEDSTICMVQTYRGPAEDSQVTFFDLNWNRLSRPQSARPDISSFLKAGTSDDVRSELLALPLMKATLSPTASTLTWELQTTELSVDTKKAAEGCLQPVVVEL